MGNITTKSVGDFQANVGIFSANIGVIISYITAVILILLAICLAIAAFVPMKPWDCKDLNNLKQIKKTDCKNLQVPQLYKDAQNDYNKEKKRCNTKVKQTWLLWFLLLIPLAIIMVIFSRWWKHYVHTNRTAAQVGGTLFELNTLKNFIRN